MKGKVGEGEVKVKEKRGEGKGEREGSGSGIGKLSAFTDLSIIHFYACQSAAMRHLLHDVYDTICSPFRFIFIVFWTILLSLGYDFGCSV